MNDDEYYAGARDPVPRTVVEAANQGLAKRKRLRVRSVESDVRGLRRLDNFLDICFWWIWW